MPPGVWHAAEAITSNYILNLEAMFRPSINMSVLRPRLKEVAKVKFS